MTKKIRGWAPVLLAVLLPSTTLASDTTAQPAHHISPDQAEKLFASVDTILKYDSEDSGLPIDQEVKRRLVTREQVLSFLRKQMSDDKDTARLQRSAVELEKLGLLPAHFDLGAFLIQLLDEQIAGYYDSKTRTVNLLDWLGADEQKPVLAHELCHALQDQFEITRGTTLDKWENAGPGDDTPKNITQDRAEIQSDETDTAREAVLEGQAMVAYTDWGLEGRGQTLRTLPLIQPQMLQQAAAADKSSPILDSAPLVLRESLLFPYQDGLIFEQYLLKDHGTRAAFADVLARPPASSWEILHPAQYEKGVQAPILTMPDLHPLLDPDWAPYDVGVMGALDVRMLGEALADPGAGADAAVAWDGGIYYAAQSRTVAHGQSARPAVAEQDPASIALVYLSRWKSEKAAARFAQVYRDSLPRRYPGLTAQPMPADTPANADRTVATTSEGPILVERRDRYVFISQTLPLGLADSVQSAMLAAQFTRESAALRAPSQATPRNSITLHDLTGPLRGLLLHTGGLPPKVILGGAVYQ